MWLLVSKIFICLLTCSKVTETTSAYTNSVIKLNYAAVLPSDGDTAMSLIEHQFRRLVHGEGSNEQVKWRESTRRSRREADKSRSTTREGNKASRRRPTSRTRSRTTGRKSTTRNQRQSPNRNKQSSNKNGGRRLSKKAKESPTETTTTTAGGYGLPAATSGSASKNGGNSRVTSQNGGVSKFNYDYGDYNGEGEKGDGLEFPIASSISNDYEENVRTQNKGTSNSNRNFDQNSNDFDYDYADEIESVNSRDLPNRNIGKNRNKGRNGSNNSNRHIGDNSSNGQKGNNRSNARNGNNRSNEQNRFECPGGTLNGCIFVCPSSSATLYGACVRGCSVRCETNPR